MEVYLGMWKSSPKGHQHVPHSGVLAGLLTSPKHLAPAIPHGAACFLPPYKPAKSLNSLPTHQPLTPLLPSSPHTSLACSPEGFSQGKTLQDFSSPSMHPFRISFPLNFPAEQRPPQSQSSAWHHTWPEPSLALSPQCW